MRRVLLSLLVVVLLGASVGVGSASTGAGGAQWVIRDLGTLGGAESEAVAINELGQIVGAADTAAHDGDFPVPHAFLWANGKLNDLGTLGGRTASAAVGINSHGQVVGSSFGVVHRKGQPPTHAFLWDGRMRDLGSLGGRESRAAAVNDRGQVVGSSDGAAGGPIVYGDERSDRPFLWERGRIRDLGTVPTGASRAETWWKWSEGTADAINERGQVVGDVVLGEGKDTYSVPLLWDRGRTIALPTLGGNKEWVSAATQGTPLNELGWVVGSSRDPRRGGDYPVLWRNGKVTRLSEATGYAYRVNERGQILWASFRGASNTLFLWEGGVSRALPPAFDEYLSQCADLNDRGQVVGVTKRSGRFVAYLWEKGRTTILPSLAGSDTGVGVNDAGLWSPATRSITNSGAIIGWSKTKSGDRHAVLWTKRG